MISSPGGGGGGAFRLTQSAQTAVRQSCQRRAPIADTLRGSDLLPLPPKPPGRRAGRDVAPAQSPTSGGPPSLPRPRHKRESETRAEGGREGGAEAGRRRTPRAPESQSMCRVQAASVVTAPLPFLSLPVTPVGVRTLFLRVITPSVPPHWESGILQKFIDLPDFQEKFRQPPGRYPLVDPCTEQGVRLHGLRGPPSNSVIP